jgi:hypothetical protein
LQFYFAGGILEAILSVNHNGAVLQAARERIQQRQPVGDPEALINEILASATD